MLQNVLPDQRSLYPLVPHNPFLSSHFPKTVTHTSIKLAGFRLYLPPSRLQEGRITVVRHFLPGLIESILISWRASGDRENNPFPFAFGCNTMPSGISSILAVMANTMSGPRAMSSGVTPFTCKNFKMPVEIANY
jgi:hypothetical protein